MNAYSSGLSLRDAVREEPTVTVTAMLARADDAPTLAGVAIDASVRQALERAAPIYRKAWWSEHRAANRAWRASMETLVAQHGGTVRDFITKAYGPAVAHRRFCCACGALLELGGCLFVRTRYPRHRQRLWRQQRASRSRGTLSRGHAPVGRANVRSLLGVQGKTMKATGTRPDVPLRSSG